jgi:hypothetical protein
MRISRRKTAVEVHMERERIRTVEPGQPGLPVVGAGCEQGI